MNFLINILEVKGHKVAEIVLQTNEENSLTWKNLLELQGILDGLHKDATVRAVILASRNEKFFSNGVDAATIMNAPADRLATEMGQIVHFFNYLITFDKPLLAEVSGYAMGGGAVITLASDFRFMLDGKARISFTEVMFGLPLPGVFIDKLKITVLPNHLHGVIYGALYRAPEARAIGLIDEIADSRSELRRLVLRQIEQILRVPASAFSGTKRSLHQPLQLHVPMHMEELARNFARPEVKANLLEAMAALREKRRPQFQ
ncbi:MAG: enoyl-CoA hydratase/isomerase family protein [Spirochaetales bacterium]|nr:enoyl-CoA hydratase/isomerase family protein [Spirochaetales bacterium]